MQSRMSSFVLAAALGAAGCASQPGAQARPPEQPVASSSAPAAAPPAPAVVPPVDSAPVVEAPTPAPPAAAAPVPGFTPIPETHKGKFPGKRPPKARMFTLAPGAERCAQLVGSDGNLCPSVSGPGAEISAVHIERVTDLLSDPRAFQGSPARCFEPQHAIVLYNDADVPVGWAELSLSCGALRAAPSLTAIPNKDGIYALAGAGHSYLRGLCKTLKLDGCEKH